MGNQKSEQKSSGSAVQGQAALVPLKAGCLTFALATAAILVGLWLDMQLGTTPRWMLILLVGSAPIALGGVYLIVRRSLRKMQTEMKDGEPDKGA